ncbi:hypothetical protein AB0F77_39740 [Streptomyces sp. NPDC026672]|uniref:hypothetical protein n=1 Tax=Actinomycetes TaxID=1760 RepID=UPI0033D9B26F
MTEYIAQCRWVRSDHIKAHVVGNYVHLDEVSDGETQAGVALRVDTARTFARGILALADEIEGGEVAEPATPQPLRVGDRVRIVRPEQGEHNGKTGILEEIDTEDDLLPYRIADENGAFLTWAGAVEKVDEPANADDYRALLLVRASRMLEDTEHTAADLIALARFLNGE